MKNESQRLDWSIATYFQISAGTGERKTGRLRVDNGVIFRLGNLFIPLSN